MAKKVGLTGGIGSGKSAVAECFAELGVSVIDADRIAHELSAPGSAQFEQIVARFGDEIVDTDDNLNRARLARIVFNSAQKRQQLEAILHPPIRAEMHAIAQRDTQSYCLLVIPLLLESGQQREMERVITVTCSRPTRIARLRQRGMSTDDIARVMKTQAREQQRIEMADDVIDNNFDRDAIAPQVRDLHQTYLALFE